MSDTTKLLSVLGFALALIAGCASPEERLAAHVDNAQGYLEAGDETLAEVELRNALRLNPDDADALFLQARLLETREAWVPMRNTLRRVLEAQPDRVDANLMLGRLLVAGNALDEAEPIVERMLELQPDDAQTQLLHSSYLFRRDDLEAARAAAERALALDPDELDTVLLLTNIDWAESKYADGLARVAAGLEQDPDNVPLHLLAVRIHLSLGEPDAAADTLAALVEFYPDNLSHRRNLALLLAQGDAPEEAEAVLREAVRDLPDSAEAKLLLAQYLAATDPQAAMEQLRVFVTSDQDPDNTLAFRLAQLQEAAGDTTGAEAVYRQISARDDRPEDSIRARNQLARLAMSEADREEAAALVGEILATDPENPDALLIRAYLQLQDEQVNEAIVNLRTAVRAAPESTRALHLLGRAYEIQGSRGLARDTFARAVEIDPLETESVKRLLPYYLQDRRYDQADQLLSRVGDDNSFDADADADADTGADAELLLALIRVKLLREQFAVAEQLALRAAQALERPELAEYVQGLSLRGQGRNASALEVFETLVARDPESTEALTALADAYGALDRRDDGISMLRAHVRAHPDFLPARNLLARELVRADDWPGAVEVLEAAIRRSPETLDAYVNLAQGYLANDAPELAAQAYLRALEAQPEAIRVRLALASLYERMDRPAQARQQYRAVLSQQPDLDVAANNLAVLLSADPARLDEAYRLVAHLEDATQPAFLDTVGWIQVLRGEHERGATLLRRAYDAAPEASEIAYHLGVAMARLGRPDKARSYLEVALAGASDSNFESDARTLLDSLR